MRYQRWKKRQTLQTCLCYFSQLVLIFRPRARKSMREECFTHFISSTRAISASAISINNAFSCYLQIFHSFIGYLRCFVANFLVLIFLGLFCICAILIAFSISEKNVWTSQSNKLGNANFKICLSLFGYWQ